MNYEKAFINMAKALNDFKPENIKVKSETLSVEERLKTGFIAGQSSQLLLDRKQHFSVITETQARSSMARVMQLVDVPNWYRGTLASLREAVYNGIVAIHPNIKGLCVTIATEQTVGLSDGEEPAETSTINIKDPVTEGRTNKDEVPQVKRPTLTSAQDIIKACQDESSRKSIAGDLMNILDEKTEHLDNAKKIATRLMKSGLEGNEFSELITYLQEDILHALMMKGVNANECRRRELLDNLND